MSWGKMQDTIEGLKERVEKGERVKSEQHSECKCDEEIKALKSK
jgi:hypothetical protein